MMSDIKKRKGILLTALKLILPPLIVMLILCLEYNKAGMYPFGTRSLSWCDMSQQVVPLHNQFKDILDGKSSMFLNFADAGGMNFYGVFFFFLASPFTLLVKFVPKENMMMFMNVLVMLKLMTCALTSAICLNAAHKKLGTLGTVLLSVMYPFCGYAMMYYQNIIWLDMMYLFPLLILSLERLTEKHRPVMYTAVLSASMIVNYYIGYMVVVFLLLFIGVYALKNHGQADMRRSCRDMFIGSFIAALITAVVWLPSLMQYFGSGRGFTTVRDTLVNSDISVNYQTVLPMLMCLAFPAVVTAADAVSHRRERSGKNELWLIMLALTLLPFCFEPINKMWHTGNYMSFPCRYGYMTIFLMIYCSAYVLEDPPEQKLSIAGYITATLLSLGAMYFSYRCAYVTRLEKKDEISRFAVSLWGNDESFKLILGIFLFTAAAYFVIYFFYSKGIFIKPIFLLLSAVVFFFEATTNIAVYIAYPAEHNEDTDNAQALSYELGGRVETDTPEQGFTRVRSDTKIFNSNMIGAFGYNTISHYTSLNDRSYMETIKRLGYSGVWMETTSVGGTRLTDAALSIGYEINGGCNGSEEVYSGKAGSIYKLPEFLKMGILLEKGTLDDCGELPENADRTAVQQLISSKLLGEQVVERFEPNSQLNKTGGKFHIAAGETLVYSLDIKGVRELYFDCYDEFSNHLSEPVFDGFSITVNGERVCDKYPVSALNGFFSLGEFTDCHADITVMANKEIDCASLGLFGLDIDSLDRLCSQSEGIGMVRKGGKLTGKVTLDSPKSCFISVPYNDGLVVKVNGRKADYSRVFSDFVKIDLPQGESEITVSLIPVGFVPGLIMSIAGICLFVLYCLIGGRLDHDMAADKAAQIVMTAASAAVFVIVYIYPLAVFILALKDPAGSITPQ